MIVSIVIFTICIILSAFFSSSETVYAVVNRLRLKKDSENGNYFSKIALENVEKFDVSEVRQEYVTKLEAAAQRSAEKAEKARKKAEKAEKRNMDCRNADAGN